MKTLTLLLLIAFFWNITTKGQSNKFSLSENEFNTIQQKLNLYSVDRTLPIGELLLKIGKGFLGTPYVAQTLEHNSEELLVINLEGLDCTTFLETTLALARTIKSNNAKPQQYAFELENIRYRNGIRDGYCSRLHYFSEWLNNNAAKNLVRDITSDLGGISTPLHINFMSKHTESYPKLVNQPLEIEKIAKIEQLITKYPFYRIELNKISSVEGKIMNGDMVALATNIEGMDVSHVGMLFHQNGRVYLLHASLSGKKVEISSVPLADYLSNSKRTIGIVIFRAL